jgi:enterochelin esterase-like enzyme
MPVLGVLVALATGVAVAAQAEAAPPSRGVLDPRSLLPAGWQEVRGLPSGGSVWQGVIASPTVGLRLRPSWIYLPPAAAPSGRYPVVYLLHGTPGSPSGFVLSLRLDQLADKLIEARLLPPFIAVMPAAGTGTRASRFHGEWAGPWENYVLSDVLPWVDKHLPTVASGGGRVLAGLSSGGFGAVDIGLRHPGLFQTLEAWSGYFTPLRNGALRAASNAELAAHNPTLLAKQEAPLLRRLGVRFFLSSGTGDRGTLTQTRVFGHELTHLKLPHQLWLGPGFHDAKVWRAQLQSALRYALPNL